MTTTTLDPAVSGLAIDLMNHAAERDEWDCLPGLAIIARTEPPHPVQVPVAAELWEGKNPIDVVNMLAADISNGLAHVMSNRPFDVAGVLFLVEAWDISKTDLTPRARDELEEWAKTNDLRHHPSGMARECRCIAVADRSGTSALVKHRRGEEPNPEFYHGKGKLVGAAKGFMKAIEGAWQL